MQNFFSRHILIILLILLIFFGTLLRVYNLNWGAPFYFNPDERNIASSISQLQFPQQMNPNFFAYGSLPIYLVYFSSTLINFFTNCHLSINNCHVTFEQAILGTRTLSALLSILLIPLMYFIGKQLKNKQTGILLALITATSIGFIQYSHFGTYEIILTFFTTLLFFVCLKLLQKQDLFNLFLAAVVSGILISCKVNTVVMILIPLGILFINLLKNWKHVNLKFRFLNVLYGFSAALTYLLIIICVFMLTNPYAFWDLNSFLGTIHYESSVALGTESVFYTGEFLNTVPILYQIQHVLPFLITPFLMLLLVPALGFTFVKSILKPQRLKFFLLMVFLLLTFIPQAILFVKWTRYMVPVIPFLYCCIALFITAVLEYIKKYFQRYYRLALGSLIIGISVCFVYALAFLITVYIEPDTRLAAAQYATSNIPSDAPILSEVYDLGITAFNPYYNKIKLFNFYDLDNNYSFEANPTTLRQSLETSNYIILPSQRILKIRLQNAKRFPLGNIFYRQLLSNKNGFRKIYETPCDVWCLITYSGNPINSYEETASVFDRPTLYIFKKK
jgi:4-amino-4-deoxy-L-arabinose transferase-like glycosyltransferase